MCKIKFQRHIPFDNYRFPKEVITQVREDACRRWFRSAG